ncbi:unnamed protein product [Cuscuta epithymum]|uniref:Pentatricopeptide repeat-containing protein n=1 Tax=Cuscuta epithymum TaxID=186058 RepID=A0AAV0C8U4_9ASTE|nr:unnamed protein product [Cuscuta epithymum]
MPPLISLQLRRQLLHHISSPSPLNPHFTSTHPHRLPFTHSNSFTTQTADSIAQSLSSNSDPLEITQRLMLHFSHIKPTPLLITQTLNISPEAGRSVLGFNDWVISHPDFKHSDETLSHFVDYFGRRKDFKAAHDLLVSGNISVAGPKTLHSSIDRLVRAGRPTKALGFFERMEKEYGFKRDQESLRLVVQKLCENGYASYAEKMVKDSANEIFPDEAICDLLINGWCVDGKIDEARRLVGEMYRGALRLAQ